MAFARVYIGAHYPHDVLVGLVLGSGLSTIGFWATRPILLRLLSRAEDSRLLRPLLIPALHTAYEDIYVPRLPTAVN